MLSNILPIRLSPYERTAFDLLAQLDDRKPSALARKIIRAEIREAVKSGKLPLSEPVLSNLNMQEVTA